MKTATFPLKQFAFSIAAALSVGLAAAASAQDAAPGPGRPPRGPSRDPRDAAAMRAGEPGRPAGERLGFIVPVLRQEGAAEKIGLDPEAAKTLADALAGFDREIEEANAKLPAATKRQAEALEKDSPDEAEVLDAVKAVWDLRRDVAVLQTRKLLAIRSTLTAAQIAEARKLLRATWDAKGGEGGDPGFGGGRGGEGGDPRFGGGRGQRRGPGARRGGEGPGRGPGRRPEGAPPPDDGDGVPPPDGEPESGEPQAAGPDAM